MGANKGERMNDVKEIKEVEDVKKTEIENMEMPEPDIDVNDNLDAEKNAVVPEHDMLPSPNASDSGKDERNEAAQFAFDEDIPQPNEESKVEEQKEESLPSQPLPTPPPTLTHLQMAQDNVVGSNESTEAVMNEDEVDDNKEQSEQIAVPQTVEKQSVREDHPLLQMHEEMPIAPKVEVTSNAMNIGEEFKSAEEDKNDSMEYHTDVNNDSISNDTVCSDNNENVQMTANLSEQGIDSENEQPPQPQEQITKILDTNEECNDVKMTNIDQVDVDHNMMKQQEGEQQLA